MITHLLMSKLEVRDFDEKLVGHRGEVLPFGPHPEQLRGLNSDFSQNGIADDALGACLAVQGDHLFFSWLVVAAKAGLRGQHVEAQGTVAEIFVQKLRNNRQVTPLGCGGQTTGLRQVVTEIVLGTLTIAGIPQAIASFTTRPQVSPASDGNTRQSEAT